ncbi:MAG TPA: SMP-30/gluconolactonase/LRE family protein [Acidimicrobiales bacterium]|nr:SMP-30/gluconolactonase/LRE family protein [Acidimicrobiales bacterium]
MTTVRSTPRSFIEGLVFPEGPRWYGNRLWLSDIHGHRVMAFTPEGATEVVARLDQPSGLGFLPDGSLLAVSMRRRLLVRVAAGEQSIHADLTGFAQDFANDMIVDTEGRAYVGCRAHRQRGKPPSIDCLALVQPDGAVELAAGGLVGPNGSVITPDGSTLIVVETHAHRITAFDRDRQGRLSNRGPFAVLADKTFPDGMCLDESGAVWIGTGFGGRFLRVQEGGEISDELRLGDRWGVACVLGGSDRRTLYLLTAATTLDALQAMVNADATDADAHLTWALTQSTGRVEAVEVEVPGAGRP